MLVMGRRLRGPTPRAFSFSTSGPGRAQRSRREVSDETGEQSDDPPAMVYTDNPESHYSAWDPRHYYHLAREASAGLAWLVGNYHRQEERAAREKRELAEEIMRGVERQTKAEEDFLLAVRTKAMKELEELRTETRGRSEAVLSAAREGAKLPTGGTSRGSSGRSSDVGSTDGSTIRNSGSSSGGYNSGAICHETAAVKVDFREGSVGLALEELLGQKGVRVKGVHPGGAGFQAGIKAGDIIQSIEGQVITGVADAVRVLPRAKADGATTLEFVLFRPKVS